MEMRCDSVSSILTVPRKDITLTRSQAATKLRIEQQTLWSLRISLHFRAMPTHAFTIRKLADAAGVGVEAVRYYQRSGLLAAPDRVDGGYREYASDDVRRLRFIKRAQALGYSLEDIAQLLSLSTTRDVRRVREITRERIAEIRRRMTDLQSMASALEKLSDCCERAPDGSACSIIAALTEGPDPGAATSDNGALEQARTPRSSPMRFGTQARRRADAAAA